MGRTLALARAEVLHVVRDKATLVQLIVVPLLQLLVLANAATFAIRRSPIYVVDMDRSSASRAITNRLAASQYFSLVGYSSSPGDANEAMLRGRVSLTLTMPHDFEQSLVREHRGTVHLDVNSEKGSAASIVQGYAIQILNQYAAELGAEIQPRDTRTGRIETVVRDWYNPTLDYRQYMVPGILVALVTIIGTLVTAQNIAREKEMGTLEQLNVTPITKSEFIAAKLMPFWVLALVDLACGLLVGYFVFGISMHGSLVLLFFAAGLYLVAALGIGLWISTLVETQQQAMFVTFFVLMIYLLMSGLFTPIDSMPGWVQLASELNPVRHFVTISRAILVKGAGLSEIVRPLGILAVYGVVVLTLAVRQYDKRSA
ncbi:MAG TPA: ABC transporter permease [Gemmatimonadaceae bacterium]|jgi:ABC-2 type transport system permease protein